MRCVSKIMLASMLSFASTYSVAEAVNYYVIAKQAQPFQIEDQSDNHSGIVTDIVKAIFADGKYDINYHTYPFNRMISILEAGGEKNWITYGSPNWGKYRQKTCLICQFTP